MLGGLGVPPEISTGETPVPPDIVPPDIVPPDIVLGMTTFNISRSKS